MSTSPPLPFQTKIYDIGICRLKDGTTAAATMTPLQAGDADRLGAAFADIDPWKRYPFQASSLSAYFSKVESDAPRFALRAGESLAGVVGLRLNWLRGPYLQFLGVLPAFQSAGLGALTLTWLAAEAKSSGARNVFVCASDFNAGAIAFYERNGFARVGDLDDLVQPGMTEVLLRRKV